LGGVGGGKSWKQNGAREERDLNAIKISLDFNYSRACSWESLEEKNVSVDVK
jgi:hypothetical protein